MDPETTGWKTSEFWSMLLMKLIGVAVLVGIVPLTQQKELEEIVAIAITHIFGLIALASVVQKFIGSRTTLKAGKLEQNLQVKLASMQMDRMRLQNPQQIA